MDFEKQTAWYHQYVRGYCESPCSAHPLQDVKRDHSLRVAGDCRAIAEELAWDAAWQDAAEAAGLFHDVGRFSQFAEFGTFSDPRSVDHGQRGWEVVEAAGIFSREEEFCRAITESIRYHNKWMIPPAITGMSLLMLKLVRDADKLDIMTVVAAAIRNGQAAEYPELLLGVDLSGPPNPLLIDQIQKTRAGSYAHVKTLADLNLMRLAWVYDLNFLPSLQRLQNRKLIADLTEVCPAHDGIVKIVHDVRNYTEERMQGMAGA